MYEYDLMTRFFLIRHGSTDLMTRILCGRTPGIPLNAAGREQATALAGRLDRVNAVVTSPVQRARETADILAAPQFLTASPNDAFSEFLFGDWTGKSFEELHVNPLWEQFNQHRDRISAPGGESMLDVQTRAIAGLASIATQLDNQTVAIVSHADVIRAVLLWAAASAICNYARFTVDPASLSELLWDGRSSPRLLRANDCAHLERLPS